MNYNMRIGRNNDRRSSKYFNMDKYGYIHHIINMLVLQKMHIRGISHTDTSSSRLFIIIIVIYSIVIICYY